MISTAHIIPPPYNAACFECQHGREFSNSNHASLCLCPDPAISKLGCKSYTPEVVIKSKKLQPELV